MLICSCAITLTRIRDTTETLGGGKKRTNAYSLNTEWKAMTADRKRHEPHSQDGNTPAPEHAAAAASDVGGMQGAVTRHTRSHRFLMFTVGVPSVLILCVGMIFALQNNSIKGARSFDPEAAFAALEQSMPGNVAGSMHAGDIDTLIGRLEASLEAYPNDVDGWRVLGWSHFRKQRFLNAAEAYRRAAELDTGNAILRSLRGEALVAAAKGQVTAEALKTFKSALELDQNDVRARFYSGQADLQNGDVKSALDIWIALLNNAPEGAEWSTDLRERIVEVARQSGTDVNRSLPPLPQSTSAPNAATTQHETGPTAKDVENASKLTPQDRQTTARDMVERLATRLENAPNDPEGWIVLIRSRMVLSEQAEAKAALKRALDIFAKDPKTKERIRLAAQALNVTVAE